LTFCGTPLDPCRRLPQLPTAPFWSPSEQSQPGPFRTAFGRPDLAGLVIMPANETYILVCGVSPSDKINMAFIGVGAQGFRRRHEATHLLFRNQPWILAVESAENLAMIADEQKPLVILVSALEGNIFCQLLGARRHQAAVVPREPDGRHVPSGWELVAHNRSQRISFFIAIAGARFHRRWGLELQHAEDGVEAVGAHVPECAAAEVGPSAPGERHINMIEWASRRGAEPQVPIQSRGNGILLLRALDALQPKRAARPVL